jgi:hypothetical protein
MNRGIELATAPYVARLDQDDASLPRRLEVQLAYMEARPDLSVTCTWEYGIDSAGRKVRNWRTDLQDDGAFLGPLVVCKCPIWHPSIMFKPRAVLDVGGYDQAGQPVEDFELTMRLALGGYKAAVVPEFLVLQRDHHARQSVTKAEAQRHRTRQVHEDMLRQFCGNVDPEMLGMLLRLEDELWDRCTKKEQLVALLTGLRDMLDRMNGAWNLSGPAFATLRRIVYKRIGAGARLAPSVRGLPAPLFYLVFFACSPLLIPRLRPAASFLYSKFQELRYAGRLLQTVTSRRRP